MKNKDQLFILERNFRDLNKETEELLFNLKNPLAGKKANIIKKFTRELIKAQSSKREFKARKKTRQEEALILTTTAGRAETPSINIQRPLLEETLVKPLPKLLPKPEMKKVQKTPKKISEKISKPPLKLKEKRISLITSQVTGTEIVHAIKKGMFYTIYESDLSQEEVAVLDDLKPILEKKHEIFQDKAKFIKIMKKAAKKNRVRSDELSPSKLRYFLIKHIINFGLIDPLLHDPQIIKILCDGPNIKIKILRDTEELITNLEYKNSRQLSDFLESIAKKASQKISEKTPAFEAEFQGFRIKAVIGTEDIPSRFVFERVI
tara:strand:+ start:4730 stop:5689 length:960 start_codon:yes stop_codon:yes gene_type:complete